MAAVRRCWLASSQWSIPARLAWRSIAPPVASVTCFPRELSVLAGRSAQPAVKLSLPASQLHSSARCLTKDEGTSSSVTGDNELPTAGPSVQGEVMDESGFKMEWEESQDEEGAGQSGEERTAILKAALEQVYIHGWSEEALRVGALNVGVAELDDSLFPNGAGDLVQYFEEVCQADLVKYLQELNEQQIKGGKLLRSAVEYRLKMLEPYLESWPQAMAVKVLPGNVFWSVSSAGLMVDEMWYWAGDRSADINWYTKRAMLSSIYVATELFMIQDKSADLVNTWQFLDKRFEAIADIGKISSQIEGVLQGGIDFLKSAMTTASQYACKTRQDGQQ